MQAKRRSTARGGAVALLGLAVLALHLLLLHGVWPLPAPPGASGTVALQVRRIAAASPPVAEVPAVPEPAPAAPPPVAAAVRPQVPVKAPPPSPAVQAPVPMPAPAPAPSGEAPAPSGEAPWPVYATRLPEAAELHYRVQRGDRVGSAQLQWQPGDAGYRLRLDTRWPGQAPRGLASHGRVDAEGVAPVRHAELQRAREVRAVNFQREAGRITFSGPQLAYELQPGAQDRLSWLIQLPAILQADATLARQGTTVRIFVVGTRGDAEPWRFEVQAHEALELPAGAVARALYLRREPTRPYDTRVEVWLDPAREHLPVRARFTTVPGGVPLQMDLASAAAEDLEIGAPAPR